MKDTSQTGTQKKPRHDIMPATLLERFIDVIPAPFFTSAIVVSFLMSDFGMALFRYIDTLDWSRALDLPIYRAANVTVPIWLSLISSTIFFCLFIYGFYFVRFSRSIVREAEKNLSPLLSKNGSSYLEIFGRNKHDNLFMLLLGVCFTIPFSSYFIINFQYSAGVFSLVHAAISASLAILMIVAIVFVYFKTLKGLNDMGKQPLNLKPFYEDSMYGLRHAGKLSLTLTAYYFLMIIILSLALATSTFQPLGSQLGAVLLSLVGVSLFFLSLKSFHTRMREQKKVDKEKIRFKLVPVLEEINQSSISEKSINDLWNLNALEITERKVTAAHTWPFDAGIVVRIVTLTGLPILVSVTVRIILLLLHI